MLSVRSIGRMTMRANAFDRKSFEATFFILSCGDLMLEIFLQHLEVEVFKTFLIKIVIIWVEISTSKHIPLQDDDKLFSIVLQLFSKTRPKVSHRISFQTCYSTESYSKKVSEWFWKHTSTLHHKHQNKISDSNNFEYLISM